MSWSALGSGVDVDGFHLVSSLAVVDDGSGPALYAGSSFGSAGGVIANHIAKWDGSSWSAVGSGTASNVEALSAFRSPSGSSLIAGGFFASAPDSHDSYLARWARPVPCLLHPPADGSAT